MVATNSVAKRTGNISAGTSIFAMVVLERSLVISADRPCNIRGWSLVGMVHIVIGTSDINAVGESVSGNPLKCYGLTLI